MLGLETESSSSLGFTSFNSGVLFAKGSAPEVVMFRSRELIGDFNTKMVRVKVKSRVRRFGFDGECILIKMEGSGKQIANW